VNETQQRKKKNESKEKGPRVNSRKPKVDPEDYDEGGDGGGDDEIRASDYADVYDRYDEKTDYEELDYSYDSNNNNNNNIDDDDKKSDDVSADPDYGDFYDYNYEQVSISSAFYV